jgi:hypothetical protein
VISGSYWPGDITLFLGLGDGKYAAGQILKDADGKNLNAGPPWESEKKPEMDSLAAAPWLVDFDGDGDLDMLVGNIAGRVIRIENQGTAKEWKFVRKGPLQAGGETMNVANNDSGPTTFDWDGDGDFDLIVGGGDGSVVLFVNEGTSKAPKFAAGVALVPPGKNGGGSVAAGTEPTRPAMRTKVHVADWNGDGHADLLVGDYTSILMPEPKLTPEQTKRRDELRKEQQAMWQKLSPLFEKDNESGLSADERKQLEALQRQQTKMYEELRRLEPERKSAGFVWVYLRKAEADAAERKDNR